MVFSFSSNHIVSGCAVSVNVPFFLSGIPAFDRAVDNIRMGDNVVWRVSDLDEFRRFADPFVEQAKKDGRNIIYFRFAGHPDLVGERELPVRGALPAAVPFIRSGYRMN